jgi:hypothetical protein
MWANVAKFLQEQEGLDEEAVARVVARAIEEGLDPVLIGSVLATSERKEAGTLH